MRTLLLALLTIGCSHAEPLAEPATEAAAQPVVEVEAAPAEADPLPAATDGRTLMFFLNPNGRPCQMQQGILDQLGESLTVDVKHVSVLDNSNRPTLYQYGIRSLPALILVDSSGQELHRFTPGIQPADAILAALD